MAGYQPTPPPPGRPLPPPVNPGPTSEPNGGPTLYVCSKCGFPATKFDLHHEPSDIGAGIWACDDAAACGDRAGSGLWWTPLDRHRMASAIREQRQTRRHADELNERRAHALHAAVAFHRDGSGASSRRDVGDTYRFFLGLLAGEA